MRYAPTPHACYMLGRRERRHSSTTDCTTSLQSGNRADLVYVIGAVKHLAHALWSSEGALIESDIAPMVCSIKHRDRRHPAVPRVMLRLSIITNMTNPTYQREFMVWAILSVPCIRKYIVGFINPYGCERPRPNIFVDTHRLKHVSRHIAMSWTRITTR